MILWRGTVLRLGAIFTESCPLEPVERSHRRRIILALAVRSMSPSCVVQEERNTVHLKSFVGLVTRETSGNLESEDTPPKIRFPPYKNAFASGGRLGVTLSFRFVIPTHRFLLSFPAKPLGSENKAQQAKKRKRIP